MADDMRPANRLYAPDYVSIDTLAYRLDCSIADIEALQRAGVLPRPEVIGHLKRWNMSLVQVALKDRGITKGRVLSNGMTLKEQDPFLAALEADGEG